MPKNVKKRRQNDKNAEFGAEAPKQAVWEPILVNCWPNLDPKVAPGRAKGGPTAKKMHQKEGSKKTSKNVKFWTPQGTPSSLEPLGGGWIWA